MSLRDAIKGFAQGLRTNTPNSRSINTLPGAGQIEVVDTSQPPTRYNVPGNWSRALLGPGQPFSTDGSQTARGKDAENEPRSFQYISSVNSTMSPRLAYGLVAFSELRSYAESVPEVSMCLRLLTEEMKAFVPTIVDDEDSEVKDSKYDWMTQRPDGFNPFPVWLSKFLYNTLIYDAGCAYMVRNSMKKIVGSRVIDGSTIFVVIDERGEQPRPPAPAFQQIIWGVPRLFMNTRQLWYKPRHLRADAPYGRSPIEDSLPAVKLLQSLWDYEYQKYQVGNIPEMVFTVPENWKDNVDAILEFELAFNARMAGNNEERARARFLPAGMNALNTKELSFNKESYDSATNAVRMSFGILQSEVGEGPNSGLGGKGYAEAMQSAFYRMGLAPLISYVESHFNDIIAMNGDDGVKFKMEFPAESLDPSKEEEKFATRFQIGGIKRDEYRQGIGMEALGGEMGEFIVQPGGGGGEGEDPFGMGAGAKPGMLNVGNSKNIQVRRPLKVLDHPLNVLKNPVPVSKSEGAVKYTPEQAREIGDKLGVDWATIDLNEFTEGLAEEHEHAETVEGDLDTMANIALDHLKEDPQYYSKLKGVFAKFDGAVLEKMVGVDAEDDMLFGAEITNLQDVKMPKQGANETLIVSIGGGSVDARPAVWKPVSGEKPELQEFVGGEMFRRAEAVYLLDRELAPDEKHYLVPLSYMSQQGDDEGSVQHYITHRKPRKTVTSYEPEWIEQAAVLDYISGQLDRKQKNYLTHPYNEKRPVLIDSELSFSPDPKKRIKSSFVEAWAGEPLTDKTLDSIYLLLGNRDLWEDLQDCLDDEQAVENARERAQEILDAGMLPKSDSTSRLITVSRTPAETAPVPSAEGERPVLVKYDESEHPRDKNGEWTDKGGGGGGEQDKQTPPFEPKVYTRTPKTAAEISGRVPERNGKPVPISTKHVYHVTKRENVEAILKDGFDLTKVRPRWRNDYAVSATGGSLKRAMLYFTPFAKGSQFDNEKYAVLEIEAKGRFLGPYDRLEPATISTAPAFTRYIVSEGWDGQDANNFYIHNPKCITSIKEVDPKSISDVNVKLKTIGLKAVMPEDLQKMAKADNDSLTKYDPDQPRDEDGKWTSDGSSSSKLPEPGSVWDSDGIGSIGLQRGDATHGRNIKMKASDFLDLVPPMYHKEGTLSWMKQAIQEGKKFAPPVLFVRWNKDAKEWQVEDHEGRHRATAFMDAFGDDVEIPVFLCFNGELRARHVDDEMLASHISEQKWKAWDKADAPDNLTKWDEQQHPRHGKGSPQGGEFAPKGQTGGVSSESMSSPAAPPAQDNQSPARPDTMQMYTDKDGNWTPERQKLHQQIIDSAFAGKTPVSNPQSYLLGGGMGAGKTTVIKSGKLNLPDNMVYADGDAIKYMLPEMIEGVKNGDSTASQIVHEESSYLSKAIAAKAAKESYNLIMDGTGDNSLENLSKKVASLRGNGSPVNAVYVTVDSNVAWERALKRAKETGRYVPKAALFASHKSVSVVFSQAVQAGLFDTFKLFDSGYPSAKLIAEGTGTGLKILDAEAYQRFMDKSKE